MLSSKTIVISAAGSGSRLGFGHTKALLKIAGKPIIIHHLEQLKRFDDVRIVVGYDAENIIGTVLAYRKNVTFVFNHRYQTTNTLHSLYLGSRFARKYVVSIDGDLLVAPKDLQRFLKEKDETMGLIKTYSDEPVCVFTKKKGKNVIKQLSLCVFLYEDSFLIFDDFSFLRLLHFIGALYLFGKNNMWKF